VTTARTRYLRGVKVCNATTRSSPGVDGRAWSFGSLDLAVGYHLIALGTKFEERLRFHIKALEVAIDDGLAYDPPRGLGTEVNSS